MKSNRNRRADTHGRPALPFVLPLLALALVAGRAGAADVEQREFTVYVDGKQAGTYHLTIAAQADGTTTAAAAATISVKLGPLPVYSYSYRGTETWKAGYLVRMDSSANDNGKRFALTAVAEPAGLRVTVNGQQRMHPPQTWPTSYWRLPDPRPADPTVRLLDADTGRALQARLTVVGMEQVAALGKALPCRHVQLRGDVQVDLWYDEAQRLVRQESLEDGHKTTLELTRCQRAPR